MKKIKFTTKPINQNQKIMKFDPIIAVKDVEESSKWYQSVFNCRSIHGGNQFDVLVSKDGVIFICLHK